MAKRRTKTKKRRAPRLKRRKGGKLGGSARRWWARRRKQAAESRARVKRRKKKTRRSGSVAKRRRGKSERARAKQRRDERIWGGRFSKKAKQKMLRQINEVNEAFIRASPGGDEHWIFEWFGEDDRQHSGYNSVNARTRAEAEQKARQLGRDYGMSPDLSTLASGKAGERIERSWAAHFD